MATDTGPDLEPGRIASEALMDDTCTISNTGDPETWTLDPDTQQLTPPEGTLIYDGKCRVSPAAGLGVGTDVREEGDLQQLVRTYVVGIPLSNPMPPEGSTLVVTSSRRDSELVGRPMIVREGSYGTMVVTRKFKAEMVVQ